MPNRPPAPISPEIVPTMPDHLSSDSVADMILPAIDFVDLTIPAMVDPLERVYLLNFSIPGTIFPILTFIDCSSPTTVSSVADAPDVAFPTFDQASGDSFSAF